MYNLFLFIILSFFSWVLNQYLQFTFDPLDEAPCNIDGEPPILRSRPVKPAGDQSLTNWTNCGLGSERGPWPTVHGKKDRPLFTLWGFWVLGLSCSPAL